MWRWFGGTTILISSEHFSTISLEDTFGIFFQMHLTRVDGFVRNDWKDITCVCIATVHGEVIRSFFWLHGVISCQKFIQDHMSHGKMVKNPTFGVLFVAKGKEKMGRESRVFVLRNCNL